MTHSEIDALGDLDPAYLIDLTGGERALIDDIVAAFRDDVPNRVAAIAGAVARSDLAEAGRIAHALKGASGSLGATRLHARAGALELASKAGDSVRSSLLAAQAARDLASLLARLDTETWQA